MGLITKTVKVKLANNYKYYEDLGYEIPKHKNKKGEYRLNLGEFIEVKVEDLPKNSNYIVDCKCDGCGKNLVWVYSDYNAQVKEEGKTYCLKCSKNLFGKKKELETRIKKNGSIAQYILDNFPNKDIYDVWDKEKNGDLNPWEVPQRTSKRKIWIKCQKKDYHDSYSIRCCDFTHGVGCPYCSRKGNKIHPKDSLGQHIIDNYGKEFLWSIWSDKNEKSPFEYAPKSKKKVWWRCKNNKHEDYQRDCDMSLHLDFRCPRCVRENKTSMIEEKNKKYLEEIGYNVLTEYDCTIKPINPKTKMPMPYDNEILLYNGKHLIIEVHGEQHYDGRLHKLTHKSKSADELLRYQQVKDRYKKAYAEQCGYEYLEIPYTAFDKKETYKQMIDEKIEEILHNTKAS